MNKRTKIVTISFSIGVFLCGFLSMLNAESTDLTENKAEVSSLIKGLERDPATQDNAKLYESLQKIKEAFGEKGNIEKGISIGEAIELTNEMAVIIVSEADKAARENIARAKIEQLKRELELRRQLESEKHN